MSGNVWLSIADLLRGTGAVVDDSKEYLSDEGRARGKIVKAGTLLLSFKLTIGRLAFAGCDLQTNEAIAALEIKDSAVISKAYLYWFLMFFDWEKASEGEDKIKGKTLNKAKLRLIEVLIPPLDEQQRIVAVLDKAFAGIATVTVNAQKNLTNARALFEVGLENTFSGEVHGWEKKPFSELCTIKHGFAFKSEFFGTNGDYVLLTPGNFYEAGGYRDRGKKQKFYTGEVPPDFVLDEGDLLVAMTEQADGLLGSPIIVPNGATFLHNQRLGLVEPKPGVPWCAEFFFHAFNTKSVRLTLRKTGTGAKVRHTSPKKIGDVKIAYPKTEMQQRQVAAKLTKLEFQANELANIQKQKMASLSELKQSLLQKAFAGELT